MDLRRYLSKYLLFLKQKFKNPISKRSLVMHFKVMDEKLESDSEGFSEPDISMRLSSVHTKSVFNITLDLPDDESTETKERSEYEKRLNDEIDEWLSLLKRTKQSISGVSAVNKIVDYSVLSPDKLAYLKRAPDLSKFVEESLEFRKEAKAYLEVDYDEILEMHENLVELCNNRLTANKSQLIEKYIFNNPQTCREIN